MVFLYPYLAGESVCNSDQVRIPQKNPVPDPQPIAILRLSHGVSWWTFIPYPLDTAEKATENFSGIHHINSV